MTSLFIAISHKLWNYFCSREKLNPLFANFHLFFILCEQAYIHHVTCMLVCMDLFCFCLADTYWCDWQSFFLFLPWKMPEDLLKEKNNILRQISLTRGSVIIAITAILIFTYRQHHRIPNMTAKVSRNKALALSRRKENLMWSDYALNETIYQKGLNSRVINPLHKRENLRAKVAFNCYTKSVCAWPRMQEKT